MSGPNYAAECGIKCAEPKFQHFLRDATKLPVTNKEEAAEAVRVLCDVRSRSQFNNDQRSAESWQKAKRLYGLWRAGHGTNAAGHRHKPNIMGRVAFSRGTMLQDNPFDRPELDNDDETDFDLWELGWRKAAREYAK